MGHPRLPALAAHVFVANLDTPVLSDEDAHHILRVLRMRPGESLTVSDGVGRWRRGIVTSDAIEPDGDVFGDEAPSPAVTIAFALTKGDKPELTVQKLCEIGVDRIVPVQAARSIVKWDLDKQRKNVERWRAVARAAAMQSRRVWLPEITDVVTPDRLGPAAFAHPGGAAVSLGCPSIAIGPEGGWTDEEVADRPRVDLGTTTLRAETAAIVAGALLVGLRDHRLAEVSVSSE